MGSRTHGFRMALTDLKTVRHMSAVMTWTLVKVIDKTMKLMYGKRSNRVDELCQEKLRIALDAGIEAEKAIQWVIDQTDPEKMEEDNESIHK